MIKDINNYLLDDEYIDTKLCISNIYIKYHYKTYFFGAILFLALAVFMGYSAYPEDWGYDIDYVNECIETGIVFFIFLESLLFLHFLYFIHFKSNEYLITNKRIICFNRISHFVKSMFIKDISKLEIKNSNFHTIKKELNFKIKIKYEDTGHYLKNIYFFKNNSNLFPFIKFKYLEDDKNAISILKKHDELCDKFL